MVDRFDRFTTLISAGHRSVQKIQRDEMEKYGLKGAFAQYLLAMARSPGGISATELCEVCDRDKAAVSRILAEMEAKGLICRADPGESSYRARMMLTPVGKEATEYVKRRATVAVELAGQGLSEEDRQTFYASLDRIIGNLDTLCQNGLPEEVL